MESWKEPVRGNIERIFIKPVWPFADSGIPEAIAAAILVLAIGKVLIGVFRKMNIGNV